MNVTEARARTTALLKKIAALPDHSPEMLENPSVRVDIRASITEARSILQLIAPPNRSRAGTPWNDEEDQQLRMLWRDGRTVKAISNIHGRTEAGIQARLERLGLMAKAGAR